MNQNPPNPYPNPPPFTFLPQNPKPNFPNPSFPPKPEQPLPPPPPPPTLQTTLTTLTHLINLATTTLTTTKLPINFTSCPYNPHHRMPPESLFHHSLKCPSSPRIINLEDLSLPTLHYPHSLKPESELQKQNHLILSNSTDDLFFLIDGYGDLGLNLFYKDCPGVFCSTELDASKRVFTLPSVLSVHCANFVGTSSSNNNYNDSNNGCGILPSDLLNVTREVEGWNAYPCSYSLLVGRVVSGLCVMKECDVVRWIIVNSPRYGVVIDVAMRDHVFVLLRLCLKAVAVEGCRSRCGDLKNGFNCPVLVEVMSWLETQSSVLYGEQNGRLFSVNMLKYCVLNAAKCMSLFFLEKEVQGDAGKEVSRKSDDNVSDMGAEVSRDIVTAKVKIEESSDDCETKNLQSAAKSKDGLIYVSQVAAAVAALHERWLLEEKIKGLRLAGSLSKSQRLTERSYVIMRAEEERKKRSNYKPILEHDGLLWHRSHNQDSNKNKTKEELLAEERDYKRRRMSYRGKKAKRSLTEVARDIIEVHMEEIMEAGGIGCFVKGSAENEVFPPKSIYVDDVKADRDFKRSLCDTPEPIEGKSHGYRKQSQELQRRSHDHYEHRESQHRNIRKEERDREYGSRSPDKYVRSHDKSYRRRDHDEIEKTMDQEDIMRNIRKETRDREYRSRSPDKYVRSHDKSYHQRDHDEIEKTRSKYDKRDAISPNRKKYHGSRSFSSTSNSSMDLRDRRHDYISESKHQYRERRSRNRRSECVRETTIEDRYDPSESDSRHEDAFDNESLCGDYVRHEKAYGLNNDNSQSKG